MFLLSFICFLQWQSHMIVDYPFWDCRLIPIWKNELDAIFLNQLSGWLVWLFCAEDRCIASGRSNRTWFFRSCLSAGSWEKDTCYTTKFCILEVSSMKISGEEQTVSFSVLECFLEIKGVYRILLKPLSGYSLPLSKLPRQIS